MPPLVETQSLTKLYGVVIGVNDLTLALPRGVHDLLGPNGAGKSTFLKLVTGQLRPSEGQIQVLGQKPWNNSELFRQLGYCPEYDGFWNLSALEFVAALARLSGCDRRSARQRAGETLERVGAAAYMRRPISTYSKGMRQRTKLAQALVHDPPFVVLDEPLSGLDPVGRHETMELVRALAAEGKSVLISSHLLHEVQSLTEEFTLLYRGRVLASGNVHEIRSLMNEFPHHITIRCDDGRRLGYHLLRDLPVDGVEWRRDEQVLLVRTHDPADFYARLPALVTGLGCQVYEIISADDNLEAVFKYLVGTT